MQSPTTERTEEEITNEQSPTTERTEEEITNEQSPTTERTEDEIKIIHRILALNPYLSKCKIKETELCSF
jgi:hypothetical protein